jgi:hypothetical protein
MVAVAKNDPEEYKWKVESRDGILKFKITKNGYGYK